MGAEGAFAGGALARSPGVGEHVANVAGYRTLRDVVFGVRARLPFRVLTLAGPGSNSRIVIDVAHRPAKS